MKNRHIFLFFGIMTFTEFVQHITVLQFKVVLCTCKVYFKKSRLSNDSSLNQGLCLLPKFPETLKTLSHDTKVGGRFAKFQRIYR